MGNPAMESIFSAEIEIFIIIQYTLFRADISIAHYSCTDLRSVHTFNAMDKNKGPAGLVGAGL